MKALDVIRGEFHKPNGPDIHWVLLSSGEHHFEVPKTLLQDEFQSRESRRASWISETQQSLFREMIKQVLTIHHLN